MKKLLLLVVPMFLTGCATKVAFTPTYIDDYKLTGEALRDLQFYTSDKIVLTRAEVTEEMGPDCHGLKKITERYVEVVTIPKDTPGKIVAVGDESFTICFEDGGNLTFSCKGGGRVPYKEHTTANLGAYRRYRLANDGKYSPEEKHMFQYGPYKYMYNGADKPYASFNSRDVYLEVDRDSIERLCKMRMVAPGCKFETPCAKN
jgi:hypothetical protein